LNHDIIVIGASAGGVDVLQKIVSHLPADLGAAVFIVLHTSPYGRSQLSTVLGSVAHLPAELAEHGERIEPNRIYLAPPDNHMLIKEGCLQVVRGPKENYTRPAIDPLFRSAALSYGSRVIGVVLTGALDDGTAGLLSVKLRDGIAVVQTPSDAEQPSMPNSALEHVQVDHCVPIDQIAPLLCRLARQPALPCSAPIPAWMEAESKIAEALTMQEQDRLDEVGNPSPLSCPECGGVLYEIEVDRLLRFRCRVGHGYSTKSMLAHQSESLEAALWAGARALEESALLMRRLADRIAKRNGSEAAAEIKATAEKRRKQADEMRRFLETQITSDEASLAASLA
jgi:two-component system chemotaxis response regulator CheB